MKRKFSRFVRYLICYLQIRFWFLRPKNVIIKGNTSFSFGSFVFFDKDSVLKINNLKLKNSRLIISNSKVEFLNTDIKKSIVSFNQSTIIVDEFSRFINTTFVTNNSRLELNKYFNCGVEKIQSSLYFINSSFSTGLNNTLKCSIKAKNSEIKFGNNVFINENTEIRTESKIEIGNNVFISYECNIYDTNTHSINYLDRRKEVELGFPNTTVQTEEIKPRTLPVFIGDDVWVGKRASILKSSTIGNRAIIALGAVVTGKVPEDSVAYGNPFLIKIKDKDIIVS